LFMLIWAWFSHCLYCKACSILPSLYPYCLQVTLLSFLVDIEVTFLDYIKGGWVTLHSLSTVWMQRRSERTSHSCIPSFIHIEKKKKDREVERKGRDWQVCRCEVRWRGTWGEWTVCVFIPAL
jgi:hypothetical protein